jgi:hypothetical protein
MIPSFASSGDLPPGTFEASWEEVVKRFGYNVRREQLLAGLQRGLAVLRDAGCKVAYIDGSFTTAKELPGDFDVCWEEDGVDPDLLDDVLLDFSLRRAAQKAKYGGEFFLAHDEAVPDGTIYLEFFQRNKYTLKRKGIVLLRLERMP